jgi:hypothetical protein
MEEVFEENSICNYKYNGVVQKVIILEKLSNRTWYQIQYGDGWPYEEWVCHKDLKKGVSNNKKKSKEPNNRRKSKAMYEEAMYKDDDISDELEISDVVEVTDEVEISSKNVYSIGDKVRAFWQGSYCEGTILNIRADCATYNVEAKDACDEIITPIMFLRKSRPPPMPPIQISIEDADRKVRKRMTINNLRNLSYSKFVERILERIGRKGEQRKINITCCADNVIIEDDADIIEIKDKDLFLVTFNKY